MIYREVHTTFFGKKAADIIDATFKVIKDRSYWTSLLTYRTASHAIVQHAPNGEVLVSFDDNEISQWNLVSYVRKNNDIEARKWIAWQIKDAVYNELNVHRNKAARQNWKHNNKTVVKSLTAKAGHDITIEDAYCVYELLMSRKHVNKHYPAELVESFCGTENDPFKTEMEVHRRDEVKSIMDEYKKKIGNADVSNYYSDLRKQMDAELNAVRAKFTQMSDKLKAELIAERDNKLNELNEQFSALSAVI